MIVVPYRKSGPCVTITPMNSEPDATRGFAGMTVAAFESLSLIHISEPTRPY